MKSNQMQNGPGAAIQSLKPFGNGRAISRVPLSLMQLVIFATRANVEKNIADLNRIAQLQLWGNEKAIEVKKDAVSAAKANCGKARKQVIDAEKSFDDSVAELKRLKEQEHLIDRTCPVWWKRLLGTSEAKSYKSAVSINALTQLRALEEQRKIQVQLKCILNPKLTAEQIAVTLVLSDHWVTSNWIPYKKKALGLILI
jgi:hypothetical protein